MIKVHGKMSAGIATNDGTEVLRVKVDYLFVFAVEPPGKPADWTRIIQRRYGYVDFAALCLGTLAAGIYALRYRAPGA